GRGRAQVRATDRHRGIGGAGGVVDQAALADANREIQLAGGDGDVAQRIAEDANFGHHGERFEQVLVPAERGGDDVHGHRGVGGDVTRGGIDEAGADGRVVAEYLAVEC